MTVRIARVAIAAPLHSLFDYRIPDRGDVAAGMRVRVSFGRARVIGVVTEIVGESECPVDRLKPIEVVLDPEPLLRPLDLEFLTWVAGYYHHPPGEVIAAALPLRLRKAEAALSPGGPGWGLTPAGLAQLRALPSRAPRQAEILTWLGAQPKAEAPQAEFRAALPGSGAVIRTLRDKGWVEEKTLGAQADHVVAAPQGLPLNLSLIHI